MNCQRCGKWSYFNLEDETCQRCHQREAETKAKLQRLKKQFASVKDSENPYTLNWAVIQCYWREGLSISQMAEVLSVDERTIEFEIDIARQNAR